MTRTIHQFDEDHFRRVAGDIRLIPADGAHGLRDAQLGALLALTAHSTVSSDCAICVLPTGSGKSAVISLLPYVLRAKRVLVIAPSRIVRGQLADEFKTMKVARETGVIASGSLGPTVVELRKRIRTGGWAALERTNVVVATPGLISPEFSAVVAPPADFFDALIIDEAHHVPARTWTGMLRHFSATKSFLFTATPFRRDRQQLPGRIIYNYPLSRAISAGIYSPIEFISIDVEDEESRDEALARAAIECRNEDTSEPRAILVRADKVDAAHSLQALYEALGVELELLTHKTPWKDAREILRRVKDGECAGLVAIGVLGEGVDLPRLKIAVYHSKHKSLPATLQFIGRIARVRTGAPGHAQLIATKSDISPETRTLYSEDEAWATLIPRLAEAAVEREEAERNYIADIRPQHPPAFSLHALRPKRQVEVFEVETASAVDLAALISMPPRVGGIYYSGTDAANEMYVCVTRRINRPRWMSTDALDAPAHELIVAVLVIRGARRLLFVQAPTPTMCEAVRRALVASDIPRLGPVGIDRILHSEGLQAFTSLGLRPSFAGTATKESYRMLAGGSVDLAVTAADAGLFGLGHVSARRMAGGTSAAIGVSFGRAKVWEPASSTLLEFRDWCRSLADVAVSAANAQKRLIAISAPQQLVSYPRVPIAGALHWRFIQGDCQAVRASGEPIDLADAAVSIVNVASTQCTVALSFGNVEFWKGQIAIDGRITSAVEVEIQIAGAEDRVKFSELLSEYPFTLVFASGESISGNNVVSLAPSTTMLPSGLLTSWSWAGVDITAEAKPKAAGDKTVQQAVIDKLRQDHPTNWIICDDGSQEIADIVMIQRDGSHVAVHVYHCKYLQQNKEGTAKPGARVDDAYEVLGQAVKWTRFRHPRVFWKKLQRRLDGAVAKKLVQGDAATLMALVSDSASEPPATRFAVTVVQPAFLKKSAEQSDAVRLLILNAESWLRQHDTSFSLVSS